MNLYKREGRRFVKVDIPNVVDNSGKYYQKDGSFVEERTKDSIGLCIISTPKEHVVMSLRSYLAHELTFANAKPKAALMFKGKGEIPKLQELITALILFRTELHIGIWEKIWSIEPITSAPHAAYAINDGFVDYDAASWAIYVAGLRPIVRIQQK